MVEMCLEIMSDLANVNYLDVIGICLSVATVVILAFTLYFVKKYTKAAEVQTKEIILQRKLSMLPSILFDLRINPESDERNTIMLTNVGNGTAVNITIERIEKPFKSSDENYFEFKKINSITMDFQKELSFDYFLKGQDKRYLPSHETLKKEALARLKHTNFNTFDIKISFQDIEGNNYHQVNKYIHGVYQHGSVERIV